MLSTKHKIINNFDKKADTYTAAASVQAHVAARLAGKLAQLRPRSVLEIGCGTGLLSQHLLTLFPNASFLFTDAAPSMVEHCKRTITHGSSIQFACVDGEQFKTIQPYDLIASSMTLHWFTDLQRSFIELTQHLQRGGQFVFSILGENSFKEWQRICREFTIPTATPLFPAEHLLHTMLPNVHIEVETYQHTYANAYAFLNSLKNLGATAARVGYIPLPSGKLRHVLRQFDAAFTVSYEVLYGRYIRT